MNYRDFERVANDVFDAIPEHFREGILYLDGDGRALFDGDMQHAELRGHPLRARVRHRGPRRFRRFARSGRSTSS